MTYKRHFNLVLLKVVIFTVTWEPKEQQEAMYQESYPEFQALLNAGKELPYDEMSSWLSFFST